LIKCAHDDGCCTSSNLRQRLCWQPTITTTSNNRASLNPCLRLSECTSVRLQTDRIFCRIGQSGAG
jgi:hypothetical protein